MRTFAIASYFQYLLSGFCITTIGSVLPQLMNYYGLSYTIGGQLVLMGSVGFMAGVPLSSYLLNRMSEKGVLAVAALLIALSQTALFVLPPFGAVMALNFTNSVGVGILETVVATLMMEVFVGRRAVVMSYLEVSFGVGALLMPLIASFFIAHDVWKYSFLVTGLLSFAMAASWGMIRFAKGEANTTGTMDAAAPPPQSMTRRTKRLLLCLFAIMILLYTGIEGSLNNFLSSVFIEYLDQIPSYASLSLGVYWTAMVVGRVATGWIIRKVTYSHYLMWSMAGTLAMLCVFILWHNAAAGYAMAALLGLTMSGIYSITMVYANHTFPGMARFVTGMITGFAGFGMAALPAAVGFMMDRAGIAAALWLVAGFCGLFMLALLVIFSYYRKPRENAALLESI